MINVITVSCRIARAMLLCPYKSDNCTANSTICQPPFTVSIVTSSSNGKPLNFLPVVNLSARRSQLSSSRSYVTLSDENVNNSTTMKSSKSMVSFAICVRPIFGKSITADDLIEFIEVNRVFGAELFFFYVDDSIDSNVLRCIRNYERLGVVESTPWRLPPNLEERIPEKGQYFAMTECGYRLMYRTEYLIIQDIDELIVPTRTDDWKSMLSLIGAESRIASYSFRNRFILTNAPTVQPIGVAISANWSDRFRVLTKITGETHLYPWKDRSKIMAPPERILVWHTHEICDHQVVPPGEWNTLVDEKDAVLHHYRKPHANYTRMWHFASKVSAGLRNGLYMNGFIL